MNQVSWLIYLANISGNLGGLLIFLGIVAAIFGIGFFVLALEDEISLERWAYSDAKIAALKSTRKEKDRMKTCVYFVFVCWIAAALCPSQDTVLAIAASQFGEQLLHTKTANLAEQALNSWLEKQINQTKPAPSK